MFTPALLAMLTTDIKRKSILKQYALGLINHNHSFVEPLKTAQRA